MLIYDKTLVRDALTVDNIIELLQMWGGDPIATVFGALSSTICHNEPGVGSKKLYYYENSKLFQCYTGCANPSFDIFELVIKVMKIQNNTDFDLNDAVKWIAIKFNITGDYTEQEESSLDDWKFLANYERIQNIEYKNNTIVTLKEYDEDILNRFNYKVKIAPWLDEGISESALAQAKIGYYPGGEQITIPHFDINGRFIGLRGRALGQEESERFGKYRPLRINKVLYSHPLGMNLYNLNFSKDKIKEMRKAIVFEGEKSNLLYKSFFGIKNDISVACCGSNLSAYQVQLLLGLGVEEIIIAFDRQFQELGDEEFTRLKRKLITLHNKYKNYVNLSFIFDKYKRTGYKDAPVDCGKDMFLQLFKERIVL